VNSGQGWAEELTPLPAISVTMKSRRGFISRQKERDAEVNKRYHASRRRRERAQKHRQEKTVPRNSYIPLLSECLNQNDVGDGRRGGIRKTTGL